MPQWYTWSATLRNLSASASSIKPSTTFTEFSQPPDLGRLLSHDGKTANRVKGSANAIAKPNMPTIGRTVSPPAEATRMLPTIGPVQEKDTSTNVKAMKNTPAQPPLSACESTLVSQELGKVI